MIFLCKLGILAMIGRVFSAAQWPHPFFSHQWFAVDSLLFVQQKNST